MKRRDFLRAGGAGVLALALGKSDLEAGEPLRKRYLNNGPGSTYEALHGSMVTGYNYNGLHIRHNGFLHLVPPNGRHEPYFPNKDNVNTFIGLGNSRYHDSELNAFVFPDDYNRHEDLYLEFNPGCEYGGFDVPRSNPNGYANVQVKMTPSEVGGYENYPAGIFVRNMRLNSFNDNQSHPVVIPFGKVQISSGNLNLLYQGLQGSSDGVKDWDDTPTGGPRQSADFFVNVAPNLLFHFASGKMTSYEEPGFTNRIAGNLSSVMKG